MNEKSMTLLTQKEIDILLQFIKEKNEELPSGVLTQESIDKLVQLLDQAMAAQKEGLQNSINVTNQELCYSVDEGTKFVELYTIDPDTNEKVMITPMSYESGCIVSDDTKWGFSISPRLFHKVADSFKMKYRNETLQAVNKRYALINYGDEAYAVPEIFLPSSLIL